MSAKEITVKTARDLGQMTGARGIVVLQLNDNDDFVWASYGRSKADCQALKKWADAVQDALEFGLLEDPWGRW